MPKVMKLIALLCLMSHALPANSRVILEEESKHTHFILEEVYRGLSIPWGMAFLDNNTLLFTERRGYLYSLNIADKLLTKIEGVPEVLAEGQGGLLDIAIAPNNDSSDPTIFLTYSKEVNGQGKTALASARLYQTNQVKSWRDLFVANSNSNSSRHYGSRLAFDSKGHVFFSIGDRGNRDDAQDLSNHSGTIIRLKLDGSIPKDNPFINQNNRPEIWSYGHRNPQGLAFDENKSNLWSIEHGPRGGDEINLITPGKNYGWPVISYGKEYWGPISVGTGTHRQGMEQPIKYYVPSIAPGSLIVYSGKAFKNWAGDLFAGALKMTHLNQVSVNKNNEAIGENRLLENLGERIRALAESPEGWIYLSTDSGRILRMKDK